MFTVSDEHSRSSDEDDRLVTVLSWISTDHLGNIHIIGLTELEIKQQQIYDYSII